jgi:hypothetical protein
MWTSLGSSENRVQNLMVRNHVHSLSLFNGYLMIFRKVSSNFQMHPFGKFGNETKTKIET